MAVLLSPVGGVAGQFFDNNGNPLTGGKLYSYVAGTTTPQATYTSSAGTVAHSNPIILDAGGRVPGGEIWLTDGLQYKFVLKNANDVLIGTYDNIVGINSNFVNFLTETEVQTATAGQTVFTLTTMQYQPGTNNLTVYVDGVNQIDGSTYSYVETSSTVITFTAGLHVGALVKFTTAQTLSTGVTDASLVTYTPAGTGAVATTVQTKLRESISVLDFGVNTVPGTTNMTAAWNAAITAHPGEWIDGGGENYAIATSVVLKSNTKIYNATFTLTGANSAYGVAALYNENWNSATGNTGIELAGVSVIGINTVQQADATVITSANKGIGGVYLGYVANCTLDKITTQDTWSGIVVTQSPTGTPLEEANNTVSNCKVVRAQAYSQTGNSGRPRGILFLSGGKISNCESYLSGTGFYFGDASSAVMDSCRAYDWYTDEGFYILGTGLRVTNCLASGNAFGSGFAIAYNSDSYIGGNRAVNCGNMGFRIHVDQSRTQFIGNTADTCGYGFRIDNTGAPYPEMCDALIFQGNIAQNSTYQGFNFQQMKDSTIVGNIARNNNQGGITLPTRGGIALYAQCVNNRISDNVCYDDQGVPTQTIGFWVYSMADSGAANQNTGNIVNHKSSYGTDYFGPLAANVARNDAEIGSWTPTVSFTTTPGTHTYSAQVGRYIRNGNQVTLFATITLSAKDGAAVGNLRITGAPFTPVTLTSYTATGVCMSALLDYSAGYTAAHCYMQSNDASMYIWQTGDNVALAQFAAAAVGNTTSLYLTITYQVA